MKVILTFIVVFCAFGAVLGQWSRQQPYYQSGPDMTMALLLGLDMNDLFAYQALTGMGFGMGPILPKRPSARNQILRDITTLQRLGILEGGTDGPDPVGRRGGGRARGGEAAGEGGPGGEEAGGRGGGRRNQNRGGGGGGGGGGAAGAGGKRRGGGGGAGGRASGGAGSGGKAAPNRQRQRPVRAQ
ncbi:hypothetical protein MAR_015776 [Mya arenaria]|uniref:Uncharacterized protein n=1 Tax=Mya arenaria TaxID=6604 RepID=A0ABY7FI45_MYAAR|nr:mesenchyme-specific cell surface glycoprotein-like [Mya arenaria]XP_052773205.1 mesenchyme-specific cell surface glycoprotein-like [Mya arenaria]WAR21802.1 hypothetical protein MAR_015776 [Mya arenaria]